MNRRYNMIVDLAATETDNPDVVWDPDSGHYDEPDENIVNQWRTFDVRAWGDIQFLANMGMDPFHERALVDAAVYPLHPDYDYNQHVTLVVDQLRLNWFDNCIIPYYLVDQAFTLSDLYRACYNTLFGPETAPLGGMPIHGEVWESVREVRSWEMMEHLIDEIRRATRPNSGDTESDDGETGSASDETDTDIPKGKRCELCNRRKVSVGVKGCPHQFCSSCAKGWWWGRIQEEDHWPSWFPCPFCRYEVTEVCILQRDNLDQEGSFLPLKEWIKQVSSKAALRFIAWKKRRMAKRRIR